MKIRLHQATDQPAIDRLNQRLSQGGESWHVWGAGPGDSTEGDPVSSKLFVAADDDEVRGAVWLREHDFFARGTKLRAGWAKYPVSESLVDPAFGGVPGAMIFRLLREQPCLMALGMGGHDGPFAKLLRGMGWAGSDVPFLYTLTRPARVMRRLSTVRRTPLRRLLLDLAAFTGVGWVGWQLLSLARRRAMPTSESSTALEVPRFGDWADAIWERANPAYDFVARRDSRMLNAAFPESMPVLRLRVQRDGRDIGWACVADHTFTAQEASPFGTLRVGLIADCFALPEDARATVAAATSFLRGRGVDLIFSNQAHPVWISALDSEGFLRGPSQFALYRSPALKPSTSVEARLHINRGDCDGPVFW